MTNMSDKLHKSLKDMSEVLADELIDHAEAFKKCPCPEHLQQYLMLLETYHKADEIACELEDSMEKEMQKKMAEYHEKEANQVKTPTR